MKTTVIVTTYNRPDALEAVVRGFFFQRDLNFDLIIADDGSDLRTRDVVSKLKSDAPFDILHVWHEDLGFRAAAIRNKAIKAANGDYLIFTDGDCVPRRNFVSNHKILAEKGWFLSGNRVLLSPRLTAEVLNQSIDVGCWNARTILRHYLAREINRLLPFLTKLPLSLFRKSAPARWRGVKTCNFSGWKSDLIAVNGFEEEYEGWGLEDSDLVVRLIRKGVKHKSARQATPTLHLWHDENDRSKLGQNEEKLNAILDSDRVMASIGLEQKVL
ncbi:MAG: glycosyltransferase family 2 protein [Rhodospirillales bacterium]